MSNVFSEHMEQDYYDELFMQDAARMIDAELLEDLKASQELEIDEKWLQDLEQRTSKRLRFKTISRRVIRSTRRIGRIAAIFFLIICILFGGIYMTVDAARETINNFLLGKSNRRNATVFPTYFDAEAYPLIPIDWTGPICPTWMPDEYLLFSSGTKLDRYWWLIYNRKENISHSICIYIWDSTYKPYINIESYELVADNSVQEVPATIYHDTKNAIYSLIMVKNDFTIQIVGSISYADIVEIAEKIIF